MFNRSTLQEWQPCPAKAWRFKCLEDKTVTEQTALSPYFVKVILNVAPYAEKVLRNTAYYI